MLSNTPALHEVDKAICQLKHNKAAGTDGIPTEALKCGGTELLLQLHTLACLIWKEESIHEELRDATVLKERCREKNLPLYMVAFDLKKAFDTNSQDVLWSVLLRFGCTMKFVTILRLIRNDMEVVVMTNGSTTNTYHVQT
eukprot:g33586.t1